MTWQWFAFPLLGYLLGSIPTGVLLGRVVGVDPRGGGSGNIGASNVTRTLGKKWGAITLLVDVIKGLVPTWLALWLAGLDVACVTGGCAVLGHCFSVFLKLKGGKGVATSFGALVIFAPVVVLIAAIVWVALLLFTRTPAIGSLAAATLFVVLSRVDKQPFAVQMLTLGLLAIIVLRHASNLRVLKKRAVANHARRKRRRR